MTDDVDGMTVDVSTLVAADGADWGGFLSDIPQFGVPPELLWHFTFPLEQRSAPVFDELSLEIGWRSPEPISWRNLAGRVLVASRADRATLNLPDEFRFDRFEVDVEEQRGSSVRAVAVVSGDRDGAGVQSFVAEAWLEFSGIRVTLRDAATADAALARLGEFTDTGGLTAARLPHGEGSFLFVPERP